MPDQPPDLQPATQPKPDNSRLLLLILAALIIGLAIGYAIGKAAHGKTSSNTITFNVPADTREPTLTPNVGDKITWTPAEHLSVQFQLPPALWPCQEAAGTTLTNANPCTLTEASKDKTYIYNCELSANGSTVPCADPGLGPISAPSGFSPDHVRTMLVRSRPGSATAVQVACDDSGNVVAYGPPQNGQYPPNPLIPVAAPGSISWANATGGAITVVGLNPSVCAEAVTPQTDVSATGCTVPATASTQVTYTITGCKNPNTQESFQFTAATTPH